MLKEVFLESSLILFLFLLMFIYKRLNMIILLPTLKKKNNVLQGSRVKLVQTEKERRA